MENKIVNFSIEDGKLCIAVDPNKDGQPVLEVKVDLAEAMDEISALFNKEEKA